MERRKFLQSAAAMAAMQRVGGAVVTAQLAPRFGDGRDWWFEKRFGMFVHWGLYSINGFHEQEQWRGRVPRAEYVKLRQKWNPVQFNPDAWLDLAAEAG